MIKSPISAFEEFLEITRGNKIQLYESNPDAIKDLIKPFLLNPDKYSRHVDLMSEARFAIKFYGLFKRIMPKFIRKMMFKGKWSNEFMARLEKMKEELSENIVPCELKVDFLPTKLLETPSEWKSQNKQIHLLEIRSAIIPIIDLLPNSLELKIEILNSEPIQLIDSFPVTSFSEAGEYEIGMTTTGKFVNSSSSNAGIKLKAESKPLSVGLTAETKKSKEILEEEKMSYQFKYTNKIIKIIGSAVGKSAIWKLLRTSDHLPLGGIEFYISILIPNEIKLLKYHCTLNSDIESFGIVNLSVSGEIIVSS